MRILLVATVAAGLVTGAFAARPQIALAQQPTPEPEVAFPEAETLAAQCAVESTEADPFLAAVMRARAIENEDAAKAALAELEPEARRMAQEAPDDPAAQYRLAAVLGARLDHEHGGSKMAGAEELRPQAQRVLELEPGHPGASFMLGKIHASVMRLGGFKRFMAKQLFGGGALEGASWEQAQELLEAAVRGAPCVPDHHWELARVYAERDDVAGAERELAYVRELTAGQDGRLARIRERAEELSRSL
jgi:hypothetical protein